MMMRMATLALAAGLLSGCANLAAVSDLSAGLVKAGGTWNGVASELPASCVRQSQFNASVRCADSEAAANGLKAANTVLLSYFEALQAAADAGTFTVQPGLDKLAGSVSAVPGVNTAQVEAVTGLAGLLIGLGTNALREATLRELIGEGAPRAQRVLDLLKQAVPPALKTALETERGSLRNWYAVAIQTEGKAAPDCVSPPRAFEHSGTTFLLAQDYCRRVAVLDGKAQVLADYEASLASARTALDELQSNKARLSAREIARRFQEIRRDLDAKVDAVETAFAKGDH